VTNNTAFKDIDLHYLDELEPENTNRNTNVDYVVATASTFYLVELKTDTASLKKADQLIYYAYYARKPFAELFEFFESLSHKKWKEGLAYFSKQYHMAFNKDIEVDIHNKIIKVLYIGPDRIEKTDEYKKLKTLLGNNLAGFISLENFANHIENDPELSILLRTINKD
jgi:hypothetical protein